MPDYKITSQTADVKHADAGNARLAEKIRAEIDFAIPT